MNYPVYLNGEYLPAAEAKVSALDRGFLFADGVYEVIPVLKGTKLHAQQHFERLEKSLAALDIPAPLTTEQWHEVFDKLLADNKTPDHEHYKIYIQITRGVMPERSHHYHGELTPTVFAKVNPLVIPTQQELEQGYSAIAMPDIRRSECYVKSISLLANILLTQEAKRQDAAEAILVRDGVVTEGASSNVFIVKDGIIKTTPLSPQILAGTTRRLVIDLAHKHKLTIAEETITEKELMTADEIWITSSLRGVFPITRLNDTIIGDGTAGTVTRTLMQAYQTYLGTLQS